MGGGCGGCGCVVDAGGDGGRGHGRVVNAGGR